MLVCVCLCVCVRVRRRDEGTAGEDAARTRRRKHENARRRRRIKTRESLLDGARIRLPPARAKGQPRPPRASFPGALCDYRRRPPPSNKLRSPDARARAIKYNTGKRDAHARGTLPCPTPTPARFRACFPLGRDDGGDEKTR